MIRVWAVALVVACVASIACAAVWWYGRARPPEWYDDLGFPSYDDDDSWDDE